MRGGTDGSALSARGIPTPNYFTGALNFHSRYEFLPISAFRDAYRVTERIVHAGRRAAPPQQPGRPEPWTFNLPASAP